jgi:hypothetical protein
MTWKPASTQNVEAVIPEAGSLHGKRAAFGS